MCYESLLIWVAWGDGGFRGWMEPVSPFGGELNMRSSEAINVATMDLNINPREFHLSGSCWDIYRKLRGSTDRCASDPWVSRVCLGVSSNSLSWILPTIQRCLFWTYENLIKIIIVNQMGHSYVKIEKNFHSGKRENIDNVPLKYILFQTYKKRL